MSDLIAKSLERANAAEEAGEYAFGEEAVACVRALAAALEEAERLLAEAYDGWGEEGHATNSWRAKVERLGAWPPPQQQEQG